MTSARAGGTGGTTGTGNAPRAQRASRNVLGGAVLDGAVPAGVGTGGVGGTGGFVDGGEGTKPLAALLIKMLNISCLALRPSAVSASAR